MRRIAIGCLCVAFAACGESAMVDPTPDAPPPYQVAPHTPLPLLVPHSGKILDHVQLVTITYSDYTNTAAVESFGDEIVASTWYTSVGAEYGVGAGTHAMKVHLGKAPTTTLEDTDLETLMQSLVTGNMVPTPPASGNEYLYMIYIPSSVPLGSSLQGFYGYHQMTSAAGTSFPFAVVLDDGSGIDTTTSTAAHELIEAATDPYDPPNAGWYTDPPSADPWYLILGEIADLCDGEALIRSGNFAVQRVWSNTAAMAGKSPCVPYDPDDVWMDVSSDPALMPTIAAGQTATFTLTGWSTAEVPDWDLSLYVADYSDLAYGAMQPHLDATTINNGKTVTLTLKAPASAAHGSFGGVYVLSGDQQRPWAVGFVVQ